VVIEIVTTGTIPRDSGKSSCVVVEAIDGIETSTISVIKKKSYLPLSRSLVLVV
jgi:hypothetical protein